MIRHIEVSNFKSFDRLDVDLGAFSVLVGANASGKTNFVQVLQFVRDIADQGLRNAVSLQGNVPYLRNMALVSADKLTLSITTDERRRPVRTVRDRKGGLWSLLANEARYELTLVLSGNGRGCEVECESLEGDCELWNEPQS